jgi:hypothetical protein
MHTWALTAAGRAKGPTTADPAVTGRETTGRYVDQSIS